MRLDTQARVEPMTLDEWNSEIEKRFDYLTPTVSEHEEEPDADSGDGWRLEGMDSPEVFHDIQSTGDRRNPRKKVYEQLDHMNAGLGLSSLADVDYSAEDMKRNKYLGSDVAYDRYMGKIDKESPITAYEIYNAGNIAYKAALADAKLHPESAFNNTKDFSTGREGFFGRELIDNPKFTDRAIAQGYAVPGSTDEKRYELQLKSMEKAKRLGLGLWGKEIADPRIMDAMYQTSYAKKEDDYLQKKIQEDTNQLWAATRSGTQGLIGTAAKGIGSGLEFLGKIASSVEAMPTAGLGGIVPDVITDEDKYGTVDGDSVVPNSDMSVVDKYAKAYGITPDEYIAQPDKKPKTKGIELGEKIEGLSIDSLGIGSESTKKAEVKEVENGLDRIQKKYDIALKRNKDGRLKWLFNAADDSKDFGEKITESADRDAGYAGKGNHELESLVNKIFDPEADISVSDMPSLLGAAELALQSIPYMAALATNSTKKVAIPLIYGGAFEDMKKAYIERSGSDKISGIKTAQIAALAAVYTAFDTLGANKVIKPGVVKRGLLDIILKGSDRNFANRVTRYAVEKAKGGLWEGGTEGLQEVASLIAETDNLDQLNEDDAKRVVTNTLAGGVAGHVTNTAIGSISDTKDILYGRDEIHFGSGENQVAMNTNKKNNRGYNLMSDENKKIHDNRNRLIEEINNPMNIREVMDIDMSIPFSDEIVGEEVKKVQEKEKQRKEDKQNSRKKTIGGVLDKLASGYNSNLDKTKEKAGETASGVAGAVGSAAGTIVDEAGKVIDGAKKKSKIIEKVVDAAGNVINTAGDLFGGVKDRFRKDSEDINEASELDNEIRGTTPPADKDIKEYTNDDHYAVLSQEHDNSEDKISSILSSGIAKGQEDFSEESKLVADEIMKKYIGSKDGMNALESKIDVAEKSLLEAQVAQEPQNKIDAKQNRVDKLIQKKADINTMMEGALRISISTAHRGELDAKLKERLKQQEQREWDSKRPRLDEGVDVSGSDTVGSEKNKKSMERIKKGEGTDEDYANILGRTEVKQGSNKKTAAQTKYEKLYGSKDKIGLLEYKAVFDAYRKDSSVISDEAYEVLKSSYNNFVGTQQEKIDRYQEGFDKVKRVMDVIAGKVDVSEQEKQEAKEKIEEYRDIKNNTQGNSVLVGSGVYHNNSEVLVKIESIGHKSIEEKDNDPYAYNKKSQNTFTIGATQKQIEIMKEEQVALDTIGKDSGSRTETQRENSGSRDKDKKKSTAGEISAADNLLNIGSETQVNTKKEGDTDGQQEPTDTEGSTESGNANSEVTEAETRIAEAIRKSGEALEKRVKEVELLIQEIAEKAEKIVSPNIRAKEARILAETNSVVQGIVNKYDKIRAELDKDGAAANKKSANTRAMTKEVKKFLDTGSEYRKELQDKREAKHNELEEKVITLGKDIDKLAKIIKQVSGNSKNELSELSGIKEWNRLDPNGDNVKSKLYALADGDMEFVDKLIEPTLVNDLLTEKQRGLNEKLADIGKQIKDKMKAIKELGEKANKAEKYIDKLVADDERATILIEDEISKIRQNKADWIESLTAKYMELFNKRMDIDDEYNSDENKREIGVHKDEIVSLEKKLSEIKEAIESAEKNEIAKISEQQIKKIANKEKLKVDIVNAEKPEPLDEKGMELALEAAELEIEREQIKKDSKVDDNAGQAIIKDTENQGYNSKQAKDTANALLKEYDKKDENGKYIYTEEEKKMIKQMANGEISEEFKNCNV